MLARADNAEVLAPKLSETIYYGGVNDTIEIRFCRTEVLTGDHVFQLRDMLSVDERARCDRFVFERDRRDFAVAHALLRQSLSERAPIQPGDWRFEFDAYGKPSVIRRQEGHPAIRFNISHTCGLVACVVTRGVDVGVDVERIDRARDCAEIASCYFSPPEVAALQNCRAEERPERFTELWTLKEAYIKAVGRGLNIPLRSFSFLYGRDRKLVFAAPDDDDCWQFALTCPHPGYRMAVAVRTAARLIADAQVKVRDFGGSIVQIPLIRWCERRAATPGSKHSSQLDGVMVGARRRSRLALTTKNATTNH